MYFNKKANKSKNEITVKLSDNGKRTTLPIGVFVTKAEKLNKEVLKLMSIK